MPAKTQQNVTVYAGDTRPIQITVRDEEGTDIDIGGETVIYRIAKHGRKTGTHYLVDLTQDSEQITIEDNGSGVDSIVRYDPGAEDLIVPGKHHHELRVVQSGGDSRVVMAGTFTILDAITHPA
jgi:hypothetical protein